MARHRRKDTFPWRPGNAFSLLADGEQFFPAMLQAIHEARREIRMEIYLFESGEIATAFIRALRDAAQRGVTIRLLLDDFGARRLSSADKTRLAHPEIHVCYYNPLHYGKWRRNLFRDHRKLLLVDSKLGFAGGWGITDVFAASNPLPWRETVVRIQGPILHDWHQVFINNWERWTSEALPHPATPPPEPANQVGKVALSLQRGHAEIKRHLIHRVAHAHQRCWISIAYFVPSWKLKRKLGRAARRGVDIRLLVPGRHSDHPGVVLAGRRHYYRLLRAGVRIFEYQPRFLHQKLILCDDWVSIGSSNLDRWNFRWNLEANQEIQDPAFASQAQAILQTDLQDSREIQLETWPHRPAWRRLQEQLFGWVDRCLERWFRP